MRIGILTFHRADNYGSVLQTYALQTYLTNCSLDVEVIDYIPNHQAQLYRLFVPVRSVKNMAGNLIKMTIWKKHRAKTSGFQYFRKNYLRLSQQKHLGKLGSLDAYDIVITGSDQIWNTEAFEFSWDYLLENITIDGKKISYAPSMRANTLEVQKRMTACLSDYYAFSLREQQDNQMFAGGRQLFQIQHCC